MSLIDCCVPGVYLDDVERYCILNGPEIFPRFSSFNPKSESVVLGLFRSVHEPMIMVYEALP